MDIEMQREEIELRDLIKVCADSKAGYLQAAECIISRPYKTLFAEYALQREQFTSELSSLLMDVGGMYRNGDTVGGTLPRSWIGVSKAITGGDTGAVLDGCEQGEKVTLQIYETALEQPLPENIHAVVQRQYDQIYRAHYRIRNLKNVYQNM